MRAAGHRMAVSAGAPHIVGWNVGFVLDPLLGIVHYGLGFFRRQPMVSGQVLQNRTGLVGRDHYTSQPDHALDGLFPALRSGALPGDAEHVAVLVSRVAAPTLGNHQRVGDGDAFLGRGFGLLSGRGALRLLALRE